jgi:hypothetical protein
MAKVRTDYVESEKSLPDRLGIVTQKADGERYDWVEDYDPVLRSHCRLDEPRG